MAAQDANACTLPLLPDLVLLAAGEAMVDKGRRRSAQVKHSHFVVTRACKKAPIRAIGRPLDVEDYRDLMSAVSSAISPHVAAHCFFGGPVDSGSGLSSILDMI